MQKQEEEAFENMEKEGAIETINFAPINNPRDDPQRSIRRSQEEVSWKFNSIPATSASSTQPARPRRRNNISFEDEQCFTAQDDEVESNENDSYPSAFSAHYQGSQEVYRKKYDFGTTWIGRKQYFASKFVDPARIQKNSLQYYTSGCAPSEDQSVPGKDLWFDSDFESGNLLCVYKTGQWEYDLMLQNDINTKGNTQWFYFRISNPPKGQAIKINIVNLRKSDSLFNYGMLPCLHSVEEEKKNKRGWVRSGKNVKYFRNEHQVQNSRRYYYTLTFTIVAVHENDVIRVAQCYPYSVSDLNNYLESIEKIKYKKEMTERETLLTTIGRNKVEALTIKENNPKIKSRPYIVILARQHPGQTPGSFVCEGLIDFLLSKQKESEYLRKNYQIKVIPMVNPDGVAAGNYRTNLLGFDLNRRWQGSRTKHLHEAYFIKKYLSGLVKGRQIAFVLDLHGHSRKLFSFFYGNPSSSSPVDVRVFPLMCAKLAPNYIRFEDSTFLSEECKHNTARVQFGLSFKTLNVFTFETSFFGYYGQDKEKKHFTMDAYRQMGCILGRSLYMHERGREIGEEVDNKEIFLYKKCFSELRGNMHLIALGEKQNSGSESSPEECEVKEIQKIKLEETDEYFKDTRLQPVKLVKKVVKKQLQVKQIYKSSRQMQVMDVKQVNSIFPNNVLALIPSSFLKQRKAPTSSFAVQTDNTPFIKIYEICKEQEAKVFHNPEMTPLCPKSDVIIGKAKVEKVPSNLLRSNILSRPRSSASDGTFFTSMSHHRTRQSKESKKREETNVHKRVYSQAGGTSQKSVQTTLTFNNPNISYLRARFEKELSILEMKTIDPCFSTLQYGKNKIEVRNIGQTLSKNLFQNMKIRRRNPI